MSDKKKIEDRAYALAEMWANDHERLAALLQSEMSVEDFAEICEHLAKAFVDFTDDRVTREQAYRSIYAQMSMIHGIVVERIFLPVAERMASATVVDEPQRRAA